MRLIPRMMVVVFVAVIVTRSIPVAADQPAKTGQWTTLFDGESLQGWDGDPKFWSVKEGAITGITTQDNPTRGNTFIIYVGDNEDKTPVEFGDFELKLEFRIVGHNSGIQYRSFKLPGDNDGWRIGGYQADFDAAKQWAGTNYGEKFRGILAKRGEKVVLSAAKANNAKKGKRKPQVERQVESIGDTASLAREIKDAPDWNEMHVIAKDFHFVQKINGVTMSEVIDNDEANRRSEGLIAVQLHGGPPMTVQVRNVRIKQLSK